MENGKIKHRYAKKASYLLNPISICYRILYRSLQRNYQALGILDVFRIMIGFITFQYIFSIIISTNIFFLELYQLF
jgi:hypothetical protein